MIRNLEIRRRPTHGWSVFADGEDITNQVMGWRVEPYHDNPSGHAVVWLAFIPEQFILEGGLRRSHPGLQAKDQTGGWCAPTLAELHGESEGR